MQLLATVALQHARDDDDEFNVMKSFQKSLRTYFTRKPIRTSESVANVTSPQVT